MGPRSSSRFGAVAFAAVLCAAAPGGAIAGTDLLATLKPDRVFAQVGSGDDHARTYIAGVTYD